MIRFAAFTDLHYDHIPDGDRRLEELVLDLKKQELDFIISLGDLCYPIEENRKVPDKLENLGVPVYYIMGNHDCDRYSKEYVIKFLKMKGEYYSFVIGRTKFIVLNACYIRSNGSCCSYYKRKYDRTKDIYPLIPDEEVNWLEGEMQDKTVSYVIFSHHSLANDFKQRGIANRADIRKLFQGRNVLFCMNGHDHGDDCKVIEGIAYYTLNSMSYIWHGTKEVFSYSEEVHKKYPYLKDMILYQEPLHCVVEIEENHLRIQGMSGHYQTISPMDVGIGKVWNGVSIEPEVSGYNKF